MRLYFSPGACSLASHIALLEAGATFHADKVDMRTRRTSDGGDYNLINPKGYVPALALDDGAVLSEGPAILQFVADHFPQAHLAPPVGELDRYRMLEWLNYIATELHKNFGPILFPGAPDEVRAATTARLGLRLGIAAQHLAGHQYLAGDHFTVADAYLYTVLTWARPGVLDLSAWPVLIAYRERIQRRPSVQAARQAEGLTPG